MNVRSSDRPLRLRLVVLPVVILLLALAGCVAPATTGQPAAVQATVAAPTVAAVATEMAPTVAAPTVAATSATTMTVTTTATVMMTKNDKLGDILADDKGMTLYLYTKDTPNVSNCYDKCATNWPPLLTADKPMAGTGADASLLGTTARKDGTMQVTYNGWPVYYWIKDKMAGDATGQDVGGVWYVLNAKGEKVESGAAEAPAASGTGTAVMVAKSDKLGDILVDAKGMTLYLYTKDTKNVSNCYDKCATNWPPLYTEGKPTAGTGTDASLFGTTERKDGKMQVTYNGWPLYYWIKDTKAGDTTGQDVGGVWYVVSPKGEEVETPGGAATTAAPAATAAPSAGKTVNVNIKDFSFGQPLSIPVGTTVVWTNQDSAAHTATASDGTFDSGNLATGATFSFTFTKAGTFNYICSIHPNMKGTITVTG